LKFSILYREPEKSGRGEVFDLAYELSLDRAVRKLIPDTRRADYFLGVLTRPLTDVASIVYRQQILRDFIDFPDLYDELRTLFSRYDRVRADWQGMRSGAHPQSGAINRRALLDYTFASLKVTAMFPKTLLSFYTSFADAIDKYEVQSEGLKRIAEYCREMLENDSLNEIERISALFRYKTPKDFEFSSLAELDQAIRLVSCDLCGIEEIDDKPINPLVKLFTRKKTGETPVFDIESDEATVDDALYISNESLRRIDAALTAVTGGIYDVFFGLSTEIVFYDAALEIIRSLDELNIDFVFPSVFPPEDDGFRLLSLRDFSLIIEGKTGDDIIPRDAALMKSSDGFLIHGKSNTGKTSLLRGIAIAHIFAQAGLPVTAKTAELSIRRGLYAHFSSAEEDFRAGDTAGRFEGEVQQMARIIDGVEDHPYSLILLNETFQTTSYSEGAEGMWDILDTLHLVRAKYIFVTRMNKMFDFIDRDRVGTVEMTTEFPRFQNPAELSGAAAQEHPAYIEGKTEQ